MSKEHSHYQVILSTYEDVQHVAVHEAFTDEEGNIQAIMDYPVTLEGESVKELKEKLVAINLDINKHPAILDSDMDDVMSRNSMEPICIPLDEVDEDELGYDPEDADVDLVELFKRGR